MESARPPHRYAGAEQRLLEFGHGMRAEMKNRSRQRGISATGREDFNKMLRAACTARGDNGNGNHPGNRCRKLTIKACAGAVTVHGSQQDLARAALFCFSRPGHGTLARSSATTGNIDLSGIWLP